MQTALASQRDAGTGESVERPIVFVIDDDESVRRSLERLLRSVWLDVQTFGTAREFTRIR
jgi:FixJ family two-component response regulator